MDMPGHGVEDPEAEVRSVVRSALDRGFYELLERHLASRQRWSSRRHRGQHFMGRLDLPVNDDHVIRLAREHPTTEQPAFHTKGGVGDPGCEVEGPTVVGDACLVLDPAGPDGEQRLMTSGQSFAHELALIPLL